MKILLVGPGIMPIPNDGWGAVENVVWQQKTYLERLGHSVDILNTRGWIAAFRAKPWDYDIVHLHYDELAGFWIRLAQWKHFPLIITTHYGYAADPARWEPGYHRVFKKLCKSPALLVLSREIAEVFRQRGFKNWIDVLPNGTETEKIRFLDKGNGRAIYLGKIERRKKQAAIADLLIKTKTVECDFAGPLIDKNFRPDDKYARYLGAWKRAQVYTCMTEYSCLALASEGEAHPLVILEALAAGLSIVITREAAANLDLTKPWIRVLDRCDSSFVEAMNQACETNAAMREQIREYAVNHFDWAAILSQYPELAARAKKAQ
jgi:glycosyltransferase involved in cell wall biosynthesis